MAELLLLFEVPVWQKDCFLPPDTFQSETVCVAAMRSNSVTGGAVSKTRPYF